MSLIQVKQLSKVFQRGKNAFNALSDIHFEIEEGDFVMITGKSGSGKSTLLTLLAGMLEPTDGEIEIEGKKLNAFSDDEKARYRNAWIGYVPQALGTLPTLNVLDNVRLPHYLWKREGDAVEAARGYLAMCGILDLEEEFCNNLSGGELKRVLIARALINDPKLLILDEPTADLDSTTRIDIMERLKKINEEGTTVLMVTHDMDLLNYGNRVLELADGRMKEVSLWN